MESYGFALQPFVEAIKNGSIEWKRNVLERIVERGVRRMDVVNILLTGERIEDYPDDFPFPSALFLRWVESKPLHVVASFCAADEKAFVITAYEPDLDHFESDFRTRRQKS